MPCLIHCQLPVTVYARVLIFSTTTNWPIVGVMNLHNLVVKKSAISFCTLEYQDWPKETPSMVLVELSELVIFLPHYFPCCSFQWKSLSSKFQNSDTDYMSYWPYSPQTTSFNHAVLISPLSFIKLYSIC